MTQADLRLRPPRLGAWLVELFASAEQAESILGDLHEEFSDLVSKSGVVSARRWYWRQSVRTIFHIFGAAFRNAPWSLASIVLVGFLMDWFSFSATLPEGVIMAILRAQRPYSNLHYGFYVWLINYGMAIACVGTSLLAVFHFFVFRWVLDISGILVAGVLVRKLRSVSSRPVPIA